MRKPFFTFRSGCSNVISPSSPTLPSTKHSEKKFAICFGGKFNNSNYLPVHQHYPLNKVL